MSKLICGSYGTLVALTEITFKVLPSPAESKTLIIHDQKLEPASFLLEQAISADGIQIFIGEESGHDVLDNCSVVTSPYEVDGKILGVLGVIGPTRMHYELSLIHI